MNGIANLSQVLRDMRKANRLTLKQVAESTGVSLSFLSDVERGITDPSFSTLQKLATFYGQTIKIEFLPNDWSGYEI